MAVVRFSSREGRLADAEGLTSGLAKRSANGKRPSNDAIAEAATGAARAIATVVKAVREVRLWEQRSVPMPENVIVRRIEPGYMARHDPVTGALIKNKRGEVMMTRDRMYVDSPGSRARLASDRGDWDILSAAQLHDRNLKNHAKLRYASTWGKHRAPTRVNQGHMPQD